MRTIINMLHEASTRFPNRAYATKKTDEGWKAYTYQEIDRQSDKIAAVLIANGCLEGCTFGLLAEGRPEWIISELGMMKARGLSVPLSIKLNPDEIAFRLNHSEVKGIFASSNTLDNVIKALLMVEQKPMLYYLDSMDERLGKVVQENNWVEGKDYIVWDTLIQNGTDILERVPDMVKQIEAKIHEDDTVNICYTSGTTGNPKGIMLTHLNYWANSHDAVRLFDLPDEVFETLVVLPVDHSFAHTVGIYTSMLKGITLHFVDARGSNASIIRNFPKNLTETNPVFLMTVPSITGNFMKKMVQGVAQKGKFIDGIFQSGLKAGIKRNGDGFNRPGFLVQLSTFFPYALASILVFPALRKVFGNRMLYCVGGGALLEAKQQHFFAAIGVPVYQGYGLTEAAPIISSNSPKGFKFGTSGKVAPTVTCKIMKNPTEEANIGERGEIVIQGLNVMKGYFKNPEATAEVLRDETDGRWLWTGDLGYMDKDGFLSVTGRAKALLIGKDGEKYSPEEVEEVILNNTEIINQLIVYNDHNTFTCALVTLQDEIIRTLIKQEQIETAESLHERIIELLAEYESVAKKTIPSQWLPARFAIIPKPFSEADGLVNSTMKLVRYKVVEFYQKRFDNLYESEEENNRLNIEALKELYF